MKDLGVIVKEFYTRNEYRPTAIFVLRDKADTCLLIKTPKNNAYPWFFPQGGINEDELPNATVYREILEELPGLDIALVKANPNPLEIFTWDFDDKKFLRDGFTKGKSYFVMDVLYDGIFDESTLEFNPLEVSKVKLVEKEECIKTFSSTEEKKSEKLAKILNEYHKKVY